MLLINVAFTIIVVAVIWLLDLAGVWTFVQTMRFPGPR